MRRLLSTAGLLSLAALLASVGCTITTGNGATGTGNNFDDTPQSPNTQPSNPDCNECLFQGCSGSWAVCQSSGECMAIYQCAVQPSCAPDGQCVRGCFDAHPSGQAAYTSLYTCDQAFACGGCTSECTPTAQTCQGVTPAYGPSPTQTTDAGTPTETDSGTTPAPDASQPTNPPTSPTDCNGCTATKCANEKGACAAGSDCDAYSQCVSACTDASCVSGCESSHASGKTASDQLATCVASQCATECGF